MQIIIEPNTNVREFHLITVDNQIVGNITNLTGTQFTQLKSILEFTFIAGQVNKLKEIKAALEII